MPSYIIKVDFPLQIPTENALLSEKDMKNELLKDFDSPFEYGVNLYP